jgi:hypothetical protein
MFGKISPMEKEKKRKEKKRKVALERVSFSVPTSTYYYTTF